MRLSTVWTALGLLLSVSAKEDLQNEATTQQTIQGDFKPPPVFVNTNLVRNTNLEKGYVRETVNVVVTNIDRAPQSKYYVPFEYGTIAKIGGFEVRDKKNAAKGRLEVTQAALDAGFSENGTATQ